MKLENVKEITVVGAGTMGHSIAQVYAQSNYQVKLMDLNQKALEDAKKKIQSNLQTLETFNRIGNQSISDIMERIELITDLKTAVSNADLVVEAVFEKEDTKKKVFSQLDEFCSDDVILASNTSGLNVFKIAKIKNRERLIIHHWFAPPHIVPLVEIVPSRKTSDEVIEFSLQLMKKIGKTPVVLRKFNDYFIVNKIQNAISSIVFQLILMRIAEPKDIDKAIKHSLGVRLPIVGVAQTLDFTGLDLVYDVAKNQGVELGFIKEKLDKGHKGAKSSKGIYDYGDRTEEEILRKRDEKYLKLLDYLEKINAFEPI